MEAPDYYRILQVDPSAEPEVIQAAYRRLAAKYHPDVNTVAPADAERRMKQLNLAYSVLSDPAGRATYDVDRGPHARASRSAAGTARGRPRFEIRPDQIEIAGVDPEYPVVYPEIQLTQVGGVTFDPARDVLDFTLKARLNNALLREVTFVSSDHPFHVRLALDLSYMRRSEG